MGAPFVGADKVNDFRKVFFMIVVLLDKDNAFDTFRLNVEFGN